MATTTVLKQWTPAIRQCLLVNPDDIINDIFLDSKKTKSPIRAKENSMKWMPSVQCNGYNELHHQQFDWFCFTTLFQLSVHNIARENEGRQLSNISISLFHHGLNELINSHFVPCCSSFQQWRINNTTWKQQCVEHVCFHFILLKKLISLHFHVAYAVKCYSLTHTHPRVTSTHTQWQIKTVCYVLVFHQLAAGG